jgi:hypothetical protein
MRLGASLMLGWTLLLLWASRRPVERGFVAPLTMVVVCGFVVTEVLELSRHVEPAQLAATFGSQLALLLLFGAAYYSGKRRR